MKKPFFLYCFILTLISFAEAQDKMFVVRFANKNNSRFQLSRPQEFLSDNAINKRTKHRIPIDVHDLPVNESYINQVLQINGVVLKSKSKWLNQIVVSVPNDSTLVAIQHLDFVKSLFSTTSNLKNSKKDKWKTENETAYPSVQYLPSHSTSRLNSAFDYGLSENQIKIHQADFLHNHGFKGESMKMGIFDAGFFNYDVLPTFDSVRTNNQIKEVWDFVTNDSSVSEDNSHGMKCFSIIAANMPGSFIGSSPNSNFYLYRTEDVGSEMPIEEHYLALAAERADSIGIDVCSISLGYSTFDDPSLDYSYADMNGNTTISAQAVDLAAKKGILMVVSAGNEGNNNWQYITTPGDADSCLTIGAVNVIGTPAGFSSIGPSSDGDVKPDVVSVGVGTTVANSTDGSPSFGNGTSFSCPNMAGIATCLWQAFPEVSNTDIIDALRRSASQFENPDNKIGYGIPDAKKAFVLLQKKGWGKNIAFSQCTGSFTLTLKTDTSMKMDVERKINGAFSTIGVLQNDSSYGKHFFYFNDDLSQFNSTEATYRIKVNIGSDTSYYIDSFRVNLNLPCNDSNSLNNFQITPNPFESSVVLHLNNTALNQKIEFLLSNAVGQKVHQTIVPSSSKTETIYLPRLRPGAYFASLVMNGRVVYRQKLLKL